MLPPSRSDLKIAAPTGFGPSSPRRDPPASWTAGLATLDGTVRGVEAAMRDAEARYLGGHDCLFPDLAARWQDLRDAVEAMAGGGQLDEAGPACEISVRGVRQVIHVARADGLDAIGWSADADAVARRVIDGSSQVDVC